jgi:hypothetical protein
MLSIASASSDAIESIHVGESVGSLFVYGDCTIHRSLLLVRI